MSYEWGIDTFTLTLGAHERETLLKALGAAPGLAAVVSEISVPRIEEVGRLVQSAPAGAGFPVSREDFNGLKAYFLPVIEEVLGLNVSPGYFQHLRHKIERLA